MGDGESDRNLAVVREVFAAVERGDVEALVERVQPDVHWHPTGFLTATRDYEGAEGVRRWMEDLSDIGERGISIFTFPGEFQVLDDGRILVLGSGRVEREVSPIDQELGWIWELRDGKVARMTNYLSHADARSAAETPDT